MSLIQPNLPKIWAHARKNLVCVPVSLFALVTKCALTCPACPSDSIYCGLPDCPNLAKIWAQACQKIACMHITNQPNNQPAYKNMIYIRYKIILLYLNDYVSR